MASRAVLRFGGNNRRSTSGDHRPEHAQTVGRTHQRIAGTFRVRHHSQHVTVFVENSGNISQRAIGIFHVAESHAIFGFQQVKGCFIRKVATFTMGNRDAERLAGL